MGVRKKMSPRICMIFAILCFISYGQSSNGGPCKTGQVTKTSRYVFVRARPQSHSASYWDQNALQATTASSLGKTEKCQVGNGTSYRGSVSVTRTGKTCQCWDSQTPHEHNYTPAKYPTSELEQNYCRNPYSDPAVWCYTTEPGKRWDFCDVPVCGCVTKLGSSDYRGNVSVTRSGKTCQRWDVNSPHRNDDYRAEEYPELVENYCRNPNLEWFTIWCFTVDPSTRWEYCIDPRCPRAHTKKWRKDDRCGPNFIAPDADETSPSECHPCGNRPCCSAFGWCGFSSDHCFCPYCVDYRPTCNQGDSNRTSLM